MTFCCIQCKFRWSSNQRWCPPRNPHNLFITQFFIFVPQFLYNVRSTTMLTQQHWTSILATNTFLWAITNLCLRASNSFHVKLRSTRGVDFFIAVCLNRKTRVFFFLLRCVFLQQLIDRRRFPLSRRLPMQQQALFESHHCMAQQIRHASVVESWRARKGHAVLAGQFTDGFAQRRAANKIADTSLGMRIGLHRRMINTEFGYKRMVKKWWLLSQKTNQPFQLCELWFWLVMLVPVAPEYQYQSCDTSSCPTHGWTSLANDRKRTPIHWENWHKKSAQKQSVSWSQIVEITVLSSLDTNRPIRQSRVCRWANAMWLWTIAGKTRFPTNEQHCQQWCIQKCTKT